MYGIGVESHEVTGCCSTNVFVSLDDFNFGAQALSILAEALANSPHTMAMTIPGQTQAVACFKKLGMAPIRKYRGNDGMVTVWSFVRTTAAKKRLAKFLEK